MERKGVEVSIKSSKGSISARPPSNSTRLDQLTSRPCVGTPLKQIRSQGLQCGFHHMMCEPILTSTMGLKIVSS